MQGLTKRQQEVLDFMQAATQRQGFPPTVREVQNAFGWASPKAATDHLHAIERRGHIRLSPGKARGIEFLDEPADHEPGIPILGRVAAGAPILAEENLEGAVAVDPNFFRERPDFALRVLGDSMIEGGIHDGDVVFVKISPVAENGQTVVAVTEDEATVKVLRRSGRRVELHPMNRAYHPIVVQDDPSFRIVGTVVGVIRAM